MTHRLIDVIVPVYRGLRQTRQCLESAIATIPADHGEVIVVNDCTPEPDLAEFIDELASRGRVTLVRNESNLGFVASVNRAMRMHPKRDVVLLNSDTEVANDWLSRLRRAAYSSADIGTVTPFSNNATICSYPFHGWRGGVPGGLGLSRLDALFARVNPGQVVDIPTAVGFCMFIRRDCIDVVGLFDEQAFGRGYGEENDFCRRGAAAAWRNVLAADVFVFHEGSVSFGDERFSLMRAAELALIERHPDYNDLVREHLLIDPARRLRHSVDVARARVGPDEACAVLAEQDQERATFADALRGARSLGDGDRDSGEDAADETPIAQPVVDPSAESFRQDLMRRIDKIEEFRRTRSFGTLAFGWLARATAALYAYLLR